MTADMAGEQGKQKPAKTDSQLHKNHPPPTDSTAVGAVGAAGAASRAFGIPELLEQILIQHAAAEVAKCVSALPITSLFLWQRVSCTFRNTIETSKELRQFMLLDHNELSIDGQLVTETECNYVALIAAFGPDHEDHKATRTQQRLPTALYTMPVIRYRPPYRRGRAKPRFEIERSKQLSQPYANWKNMKLNLPPWEQHFIIRQPILCLDTEFGRWGYFCDLHIEGSVTLGVVAEKILLLHQRDNAEHYRRSIVFGEPEGVGERNMFGSSVSIGCNLLDHTEVIHIKDSKT